MLLTIDFNLFSSLLSEKKLSFFILYFIFLTKESLSVWILKLFLGFTKEFLSVWNFEIISVYSIGLRGYSTGLLIGLPFKS